MQDPERLLRQHAEAVRRLGVDFVPVRSPRASEPAPRADSMVEPKSPATTDGSIAAVAYTDLPKPTTVPAGDRDRSAARLDAILARYEADAPHEQFATDHTRVVFGEGDPCADLMFVGEAPGAEEDKLGRPFVGRSGQLLDKMIVAMGLSRERVYIANVMKTRPPNNATPTLEEARVMGPYLFEQIRTVRPRAIVTLGRPAAQLLLETSEAMGRLRAHWHTLTIAAEAHFEGLSSDEASFGVGSALEVPVMPTYHPAFLLRQYTQENRAKVWSDLQMVVDRLGIASG